jgi:CMP-N-acetylneuraminic acid synthetase
MIGHKKVIGIMPIREGSTRIKDKNVRMFLGVPLAKYVLDKVSKCKYIDEIYVSTSSERYQNLIHSWGYYYIDRPIKLSQDNTTILPVLKHAVDEIQNENFFIGFNVSGLRFLDDAYIMQLDATRPLVDINDLCYIIEYAHKYNYDSVFPVKKIGGLFLGDDPVNTQENKKNRYMMWAQGRIRTVETIKNASANSWGIGNKHKYLDIIRDCEIDINYEHDFIAAEALAKAGY